MKNSSDTIVNRTRDLPACSAVPQPAAPPRVPKRVEELNKNQYTRCIRSECETRIGSWYISTERVAMEGQAAVVMPVIKNCLGLLLVYAATDDCPCDKGKRI
jgi:hypothetical protein